MASYSTGKIVRFRRYAETASVLASVLELGWAGGTLPESRSDGTCGLGVLVRVEEECLIDRIPPVLAGRLATLGELLSFVIDSRGEELSGKLVACGERIHLEGEEEGVDDFFSVYDGKMLATSPVSEPLLDGDYVLFVQCKF